MDESEPVTKVKIFNQIYPVRSGGDPEYIRELAGYVHAKMAEVSEHTPTVDTLKVAILAALNIADEYFSAKGKLENAEKNVSESVTELVAMLDPLLGTGSP